MGTRGREVSSAKRRRRIGCLVVALAVIGALVGVGAIVNAMFGGGISSLFESAPEDFEGGGTEDVVVQIEPGWTGTDVAVMLQEEGVIASSAAFTEILIADPSIQFHPGSYRVKLQMSSQAAVVALQDPANKVEIQAVVPEGYLLQQVFGRLSEASGIEVAEFEAAAQDVSSFGLPITEVSLEGWLFPATYTFDDGATAHDMLQMMVDRMKQALVEHGVPEAEWHNVLTFAALVQREAGPEANMPQVARVFQNRLDQGMLLQSDATVAYGTGNTHIVTTTDAERGDASNVYNTYIHPGLPVGPIGAPGDAAISAVLSPIDGPWLYFVTVNLETGETVFSSTLSEHNAAVLRFQAWIREHPEYLG